MKGVDSYTPPLEFFLKDVSKHELQVIREVGVNRHLRFKSPGSSCYWFDVITWPGTLCIDGDCGTYVFKRLHDMFEFFREKSRDGRPEGTYINGGYWAEKVVAQCRSDGVEEWDQDRFIERTVAYVRDYFRDYNRHGQLECFREVRDRVLHAENEQEAYTLLTEFDHNGFSFEDSWEWNMKKYTTRFIWNLRAIAWAIHQFDTRAQPERTEKDDAE